MKVVFIFFVWPNSSFSCYNKLLNCWNGNWEGLFGSKWCLRDQRWLGTGWLIRGFPRRIFGRTDRQTSWINELYATQIVDCAWRDTVDGLGLALWTKLQQWHVNVNVVVRLSYVMSGVASCCPIISDSEVVLCSNIVEDTSGAIVDDWLKSLKSYLES